jgi:hypothetical protein
VLTPVPPHAVPAGPLAVRWHAYELPPQRAGTVSFGRVELENAGSAAWRSRPGTDIHLSYHWLDLRGNPIVWAGAFILLPERVEPGARFDLPVAVRAPMPPGRYRLAFDLVDEGRLWFAEVGNERLELEVDVSPRLERRALAVVIAEGAPELVEATRSALAALEEPLAEAGEATAFLGAGCRPAPDWSRRILDAHDEGYGAVGGSVQVVGGLLERRRVESALAPWRPGFGRSPVWRHPLVCPSLVNDVLDGAPWVEPVCGLPALDPAAFSDLWICDGRIRVAVPARSLRRDGRPPA